MSLQIVCHRICTFFLLSWLLYLHCLFHIRCLLFFVIKVLPKEISSCLTLLLQRQPEVLPSHNKAQWSDCTWQRYNKYNTLPSSVLKDDPFLDSFSAAQQHRILGCFAQALCEGWFSAEQFTSLTSKVIKASVDYVSATFWAYNREDPHLDISGKSAIILQSQFLIPSKSPKKWLLAQCLEHSLT